MGEKEFKSIGHTHKILMRMHDQTSSDANFMCATARKRSAHRVCASYGAGRSAKLSISNSIYLGICS